MTSEPTEQAPRLAGTVASTSVAALVFAVAFTLTALVLGDPRANA